MAFIKARSEKQVDDGGINLRKLFEVSKKLEPITNSILRSAFSRKAWQIDPIEFSEVFPSATETIKDIKI